MTNQLQHSAEARNRKGITLLEVLIAGGILVVGLVSVASLLPAGGMILGEASTADRAATLATNAFSDLASRGTFKAADFQNPVKTVVVGNMFTSPPTGAAFPFDAAPFRRVASFAPQEPDRAVYGATWYGATATPLFAGNPVAGMPARVTVLVTRNSAPDRTRVALLSVSPPIPGVYRLDPAGLSIPQQDDLRKRFLNGCSWVAVANTTNGTVTWLQIANAWATYQSDGVTVKDCFVSFTDSDSEALTSPALTVFAFQGIIRAEERIIPLAE